MVSTQVAPERTAFAACGTVLYTTERWELPTEKPCLAKGWSKFMITHHTENEKEKRKQEEKEKET